MCKSPGNKMINHSDLAFVAPMCITRKKADPCVDYVHLKRTLSSQSSPVCVPLNPCRKDSVLQSASKTM